MAARLYPAPARPVELVDLRRISARDLEALLEEECAAWRHDLEWDFDKSADLVRRFVDMSALNGAALMLDDGSPATYATCSKRTKGLIGDRASRPCGVGARICSRAASSPSCQPWHTRIGQLMMVG
jgi:hypothetical protein